MAFYLILWAWLVLVHFQQRQGIVSRDMRLESLGYSCKEVASIDNTSTETAVRWEAC